MKDVMLDFENLGDRNNACIVQVGAVYFDRYTGALGDEFKLNIDARSAVKSGAVLTADTVYWWLDQSRQAIDSVTKGTLAPIKPAMLMLNNFLEKADCIWSHATYDFVVLDDTLKRLEIKPLFSRRAARDIRTLTDLAGVTPFDDKYVRVGTHHDALDDCKFQILYCVDALRKLQK